MARRFSRRVATAAVAKVVQQAQYLLVAFSQLWLPCLSSPWCVSYGAPKGTSVEKMYVISFPRNHFVRTKYVISFPRNHFVRTKYVISFPRNVIRHHEIYHIIIYYHIYIYHIYLIYISYIYLIYISYIYLISYIFIYIHIFFFYIIYLYWDITFGHRPFFNVVHFSHITLATYLSNPW